MILNQRNEVRVVDVLLFIRERDELDAQRSGLSGQVTRMQGTIELLEGKLHDMRQRHDRGFEMARVAEDRAMGLDLQLGRAQKRVRDLEEQIRQAQASYEKALWLLGRVKELAVYDVLTKSGIIVGLGETNDEVVETMRDLRAYGVDVVTIGQYLQPSPKHAKIDRWVHPDEFAEWKAFALAAGVKHVESGPLVRSSYRADEQAVKFSLMDRRQRSAR